LFWRPVKTMLGWPLLVGAPCLMVGCITTATARIDAQSLVDAAGIADDQAATLSTSRGEKNVTGATEILLRLDPASDVAIDVPLHELRCEGTGVLLLPPYDPGSRLGIDEIRDARMRVTNVPATAVVVTSLVLASIVAATAIGLIILFAGKTYPGGD